MQRSLALPLPASPARHAPAAATPLPHRTRSSLQGLPQRSPCRARGPHISSLPSNFRPIRRSHVREVRQSGRIYPSFNPVRTYLRRARAAWSGLRHARRKTMALRFLSRLFCWRAGRSVQARQRSHPITREMGTHSAPGESLPNLLHISCRTPCIRASHPQGRRCSIPSRIGRHNSPPSGRIRLNTHLHRCDSRASSVAYSRIVRHKGDLAAGWRCRAEETTDPCAPRITLPLPESKGGRAPRTQATDLAAHPESCLLTCPVMLTE